MVGKVKKNSKVVNKKGKIDSSRDETLDDDIIDEQEEKLLRQIQQTQDSLRKNAKRNQKRAKMQTHEPEIDSEDEEADEEALALERIRNEADDQDDESNEPQGNSSFASETHRKNALMQKLEEIQLNMPFIERMEVILDMPEDVEDVEDDLKREVALYKHAAAAVHQGRALLDDAEVNHMRPIDYMAEMIKSDKHMARVKQNLLFEKKKIEAFETRKKQQEYRKFAKKVQSDRMKEKAQEKKKKQDIASEFREKNKNNLSTFDESKPGKRKFKDISKPNPRRIHKNQKFGFGEKKSRKNDSESLDRPTQAERKVKKRLGKQRRQSRR